MKTAILIGVALLSQAFASAQTDNLLVPFTQGRCDERKLVVELGDTPIEVDLKAQEHGLAKFKDEDTSASYTNETADRMLIISYDGNYQVRGSAYFMKSSSKTFAYRMVESFDPMLRVFYGTKLKGQAAYYKSCGSDYLVGSVSATQIGKDWYVSFTLMQVKP